MAVRQGPQPRGKHLSGKNNFAIKTGGDGQAEEYLLVGTVSKAHGIKGEVKLFLYSEAPADCGNYPDLILVDELGAERCVEVAAFRTQGHFAVVLFRGLTTRNQAEELLGSEVWAKSRYLPEIEADEFYWHEMEGMEVVCEDGTILGSVSSLLATGAHDVLVVTGRGREYLIPATKEIIVRKDETNRTLVVAPPPGLLEMNS